MQTIVYQCDTAMPAQKITELLSINNFNQLCQPLQSIDIA